MIDLHCHVIPGIDDGPADDAETTALLDALEEDGVELVAATPHFRADHPAVKPERMREWVEAVNRKRGDRPPAVVPGGEIGLAWALAAGDEDLRRASYNQLGKDILLESPFGPAPPSFDEMVLSLTMRGYRVLLAHPERNPAFQDAPQRLSALVARGVLMQINASSLVTTKRGSRSKRLAKAMVQEHVAHVIASDAHSATWRKPLMTSAVAFAESLAGPRASWMATAAPAAILAGAALPPEPSARGRRRPRLRAAD